MKKRNILAAIGCVLAGITALSGCSSTVTATPVPDVIQVRTVEDGANTITINSTETVEVVPDMAQVTFTVMTENRDAEECQQENAENLDRLLAHLAELGFKENSIRTSGFSLDPQYDWSGNTRRLTGYEMRTQVTVTDIPLDTVGSLLTSGIANGANEIDSVSYFSSKYDEAYEEALAKAVELARGKAEALAEASGRATGAVVGIEEHNDSQSGRYVFADMDRAVKNMATEDAAASGASMNVMPGEMQVQASITVEFGLVDAQP